MCNFKSHNLKSDFISFNLFQVQLRVCKYCLELKSKHQKLEKKRFSKTEGLIFSSPSLDRPNEPDSPTMDILTDFNQVAIQLMLAY